MNKIAVSKVAMASLVAALVSILAASYVSLILTDNQNLASELKSAKADRDQAMEKLTAVRFNELAGYGSAISDDNDNLKIKVVNDGPSPSGVRYLLLYCVSDNGCPLANDVPIIKSTSNSTPDGSSMMTIYPGETSTIQVGPLLDGLRYRADIVTDRGNILRTEDCVVDLASHICRI